VLYTTPTFSTAQFGQKTTKRGATTYQLGATQTGAYSFTIGYQTVAPPPAPPRPAVGRWKGVLRVASRRIKNGFPVGLTLRNSPGIALSVFDADRTINPLTFGGTGIGIATNNAFILVTSESGGKLLGEFFDRD